MPTTHVLTQGQGNTWYLTTPQGHVVDTVTAPNHAEAALAVEHLLPRDGMWEDGEDSHYTYHAAVRSGVIRHAGQD